MMVNLLGAAFGIARTILPITPYRRSPAAPPVLTVPSAPRTSGTRALCLGGPCHGMLLRIEQEVGRIEVAVPRVELWEPDLRSAAEEIAVYLVTRERMHHPSCADPLVVLRCKDESLVPSASR